MSKKSTPIYFLLTKMHASDLICPQCGKNDQVHVVNLQDYPELHDHAKMVEAKMRKALNKKLGPRQARKKLHGKKVVGACCFRCDPTRSQLFTV